MKYGIAAALFLQLLALTTSGASAAPGVSTASDCRIACTTGCSDRFQERISHAAAARGYHVKFLPLKDAQGHARPPAQYDGLLIPGGMDINVELYLNALPESDRAATRAEYARLGKRSEESRARDIFEHDFLTRAFQDERFREVPILGICYGMQMLGVVSGLPLLIDLPTDLGIPARYNLFDEITADDGMRFQGYEQHHQAIDLKSYERLRPAGVRITATSNSGRVPEILEFSDRPVLGVQFHPEYSSLEVSDRIFGWLLDRACGYPIVR